MIEKKRVYAAIDLKSFYASVECVDRVLDPLDTCLVVADTSRSDRTICLAVSPALKAWGVPGRPRLFEVVQKVEEINALRRTGNCGREFSGSSFLASALSRHPDWSLKYIAATPHMRHYMETSARIVSLYRKYIAPEDLHVYSVDEVMMDLTPYLQLYGMTPHTLVRNMVGEVLAKTGITATAGIGSNLYLCKIAMDIIAKHLPPDPDGVRIAALTEEAYRKRLWDHQPLTDFWRIGSGITCSLQRHGMYTMGDVARMSLVNPDLLYSLFGINAELLIDHAWGWEPCLMRDIKAYRSKENGLSTGQVLAQPCDALRTRLLVWEMADLLVLDLVKKRLVTKQLTLELGYDRCNLEDPDRRQSYSGPVEKDLHGRVFPRAAHGSWRCEGEGTASRQLLLRKTMQLYDRIVNPHLLVRRITLSAQHVSRRSKGVQSLAEQSLFGEATENPMVLSAQEREQILQETILWIQEKYGKNALLKGSNFLKGAMTWQRNQQVGGHKA